MGKKGKKTRWRELPITLADKPYAAHEQQPQQQQSNRHAADPKPANFAAAAGRRSHHTQHQQQQQQQPQQQQQQQPQHQQQPQQSPNRSASIGQQHHHVESSTVTFNEDEYTKITTPRQDVLFKKGYLGRRKHTSIPVITEVINENEDGVPTDTINPLDEMCPLGEYVDPSAMYILNGGGYEIYDPYTGNVTMLMAPPPGHYPPVGHPMLAAMPYQPMPMQAVDWFNPANPSAGDHWIPPVYPSTNRHHKKQTSDAQQNTEASNGAQELSPDDQQILYQSPPYDMYPGYMFSAPLYNYNGVSIQVPQPQSPPSPSVSCDYNNGKRRKKKKRRKRGGVTDEYSDSSSEEQKSQSGASSDLVPDSEKTSDSGVLTNNSGGSTPVNVMPIQLSHTALPFHMDCPRPFDVMHGPPMLVHHHPNHHYPHRRSDHVATATAYYQPIPRYTEQAVGPIGYQAIPEEQATDAVTEDADVDDDQRDSRPDVEPTAGYSAENSDSGISSPNSEVMVKSSADGNGRDKPTTDGPGVGSGGDGGSAPQAASKKNRNKKSNRQRDATDHHSATKSKSGGCKDGPAPPKSRHHEGGGGGKKSSKIAKEPAIIKKLNAKKLGAGRSGKSESEKPEVVRPAVAGQRQPRSDDGEEDGEYRNMEDQEFLDQENRDVETERASVDVGIAQPLTIDPDVAEWPQDEETFCSLECTPGSTTDDVRFQFVKTQSTDSCESAEEETFATAVNTGGNSDTENEAARLQEDPVPKRSVDLNEVGDVGPTGSQAGQTVTGPITEAVTKWLNDQGGLMLAAQRLDADDHDCDRDDDDDGGGGSSTDADDCDSEYDDFEEHPNAGSGDSSPKNVRGNPYPAPSRSVGSRVASSASPSASTAPPYDQRQNGLVSSGICCLTQ